MENFEKILNIKYETEDSIFELVLKKIIANKDEKLSISMENEDNEIWEFCADSTGLIDIDPIFKKFSDIIDVIDLIHDNFIDKIVKIEKSGDKYHLTFKIKFIKNESFPRFVFTKKLTNEENPTLISLKSLRKEIELLKSKSKIPIISYVDNLTGNNSLTGDFLLKSSQNVTFHIFIGYRKIYGTNAEEFLYFNLKNDNAPNFKERLIYKTWHGCYQGGSGYQDSENVNFMFIEKIPKGNSQITLRKQGGSYIYTLYLIAEL